MADKTTKKPVAKKASAKKPVAKATIAKKPVAKKAPAKKPVIAEPMVEKYPCGCDKGCACAGECSKKKCTFGRFMKKLVLILIIFALGFAAAKMTCCHRRGKMGPRPEFDNGCLVIKCKKLAEMAPMIDTDHDGCITKSEFKAARKHMHHDAQPESVPAEVPADAPVAEPAPEMAE